MTSLESADRSELAALLLAKPRRPDWRSSTRAAVEDLARLAATVDVANLPWRCQRREVRHDRQCRHTRYHLSCVEFDMLEGESFGFCDICGIDMADSRRPLYIDHDHAIGLRAVRGLVCPSCNHMLSYADAGTWTADHATANYLADPWHVRVGLEICAPGCDGHRASPAVVPPPATTRAWITRATPAPAFADVGLHADD